MPAEPALKGKVYAQVMESSEDSKIRVIVRKRPLNARVDSSSKIDWQRLMAKETRNLL